MHAIQALKPGPAKVLKAATLPDPKPGAGEVLVQTTAVGVNFIDIYRRSGVYRVPFPHVPGLEGVGEVVEVGEGVDGPTLPRVGSTVAWADSVTGSYAGLVLVKADRALPVPHGMPPATAAALPLQGMTADYLVRSAFPVREGQTVALYAAAGGVGGLAAQMIHATGARLIAIVGSTAKAEEIVRWGIPAGDVVVTGTMKDLTIELPAAIHERTDGEGVDAAFDSVGKDTFHASLRMLRRRGTLVLFGGSSGQVPPFDPQELNAHGSVFLTRPTLGDYTATHDELLERGRRVFGEAAKGAVTVRIGEQLPLTSAEEAHRALEGRMTAGKVILMP